MRMHTIGLLAMALTGLWAQRGWAETCYSEPSDVQLQRAQRLADQGYELIEQRRYELAAEHYVQALEHVRDPILHLQAGSAFFNALRMVDAYEHLREALRCGRDDLTAEQVAEAKRKLGLLSRRLGEVSVDCRAEAGEVGLGEQDWFTCSGQRTRLVAVGQYVIHVTRDGHVPVQEVVTVTAGKRVAVEPVLMSEAQARIVTHRWSRRLLGGVAGSGVAVAALGGVLQWDASRRIASSVLVLDECLRPTVGCKESVIESQEDVQSQALFENRLALGSLVLGGVVLAVGIGMAIGNPTQSRLDPRAGTAGVKVLPMTVGGGSGLTVRLDF